MRLLGRIVAGLVSLLLVAALGVGIAAFSISRGWQRERLRSTLETLLADALGDEVAIGGLGGPLLPHLVVTDLRVGPARAPALAVERLVLRLAWRRSLASRSLVLASAEIRGAQLAVSRDAQGAWDLPRWLAGETSDDAAAEPVPVHVDRTKIEAFSARVAWHEDTGTAAIRLSGSAALGPFSIPPAPGEVLRGELLARAQGEGAATRWLDEARLEAALDGPRVALTTLEIRGGERPTLRLAGPAALVLADDGVRFEQLELRGDGQSLLLNGAVSPTRFQALRLEARDLDLTLAGRLSGIAAQPGGRVTGTLRLDGPLLRPEGSVDLLWSEPSLAGLSAERVALRASGDGREIRLDALSVDGMPGGPLRLARPARLRIGDDRLDLEDFELRSAGQAIVANGGLSAERFHALRLDVRALDLDFVGRLLGLAGEPGGSIDGALQLDGAFARPTGSVDLAWRDPRLAGWRGERIALHASVDEDRMHLDARLLRAGREELTLELGLPARALERALREGSPALARAELPEGLRAHLRSEGVALTPFAPLLPEDLRGLDGTLAGDLELIGGAAPQVGGHLALADGSLALAGRRPIEGLHADLALRPEPGSLRIERFRLDAPALTLEATGALRLDALAPLELTLGVEDLAALAETYALDAPLEGAFDAQVTLRGDWSRPAIRGAATWTHPAPGMARPHRIDLELESVDRELVGRLSILQRSRVAAHGELRVPYDDAGIAGLAPALERSARLELETHDFDLASLGPLLPRTLRDLRGRADARVALRDGFAEPRLTGALRVRAGSLYVPAARQTFEPIEGSASFRDDTLRVDRLRVGAEGAHADVSGSVRLGSALERAEADLGLELVRLPLARSRALRTDASGQLRLRGPLGALRLDGEIALSDTRVQLVESGDPALREIEVISADAERQSRREMREQQRPPDAFDRAAIDVSVTLPRNSWVRGRGADIDLAGTLRVEKAPGDALRLSGRVAALRGTYRFQGKRFDLRRGSVSFEGGADLDPLLDIEATHRVRDVTIVIELSGRASAPIVALSSEPTLPEDDVLSYLFFGRSTRDLGSKQPTGDLDRAATALAAGIALREASRLVEDVVPVDTIDVRIADDGTSGDVGVGKYVTDDLFLRYEHDFGEDTADGVKIELRLSDHWSVETEASTDESAGADLIWSFDY